VLTDKGFYSEAAVGTVEQKPDGEPTGIRVYAAVEKHSHHKTVADLLPQPEPAAPGHGFGGPLYKMLLVNGLQVWAEQSKPMITKSGWRLVVRRNDL
jgi:hypothetical protein